MRVEGTVGDLMDALRFVIPAAAKDEPRLYLNSVLLEMDHSGTHAVATDGFRLHFSKIASDKNNSLMRVLIKRQDAARLLKEFGSIVHRGASYAIDFASQCLTVKDVTVHNMDIGDFIYPDWRRVVPENTEQVFRVPNARLIPFMKMASSVKGSSGHILFETSDVDGELYLTGTVHPRKEKNGGVIVLDQRLNDVEVNRNYSVAFKYNYIYDVLKSYDERDQIAMHVTSDSHPVRFDAGDDHSFAVVMPKRA